MSPRHGCPDPPSQAGTAGRVAVPDVLEPAARLTFLERVIADHDDCDAAGYCLGCRRHGMWAAYPCDTRLGAERAAESTRAMLG